MHICTFQDLFQQKMEEPIPHRLVLVVIDKLMDQYGTPALPKCHSLLKAFALTKQHRWHNLVECCKVACDKGTYLMKRSGDFWTKVREQLLAESVEIRTEDIFELLHAFIKCASIRGIKKETRAETAQLIWEVYQSEISSTINLVNYAVNPKTMEEYFVSFKSHFAT